MNSKGSFFPLLKIDHYCVVKQLWSLDLLYNMILKLLSQILEENYTAYFVLSECSVTMSHPWGISQVITQRSMASHGWVPTVAIWLLTYQCVLIKQSLVPGWNLC